MVIPEGEEREEEAEKNIWSKEAEIFPKLMTDTKSENQEALKIPNMLNIKKGTRHVNIQIALNKRQRENLERWRRKKILLREEPGYNLHWTLETMQAKRKVLKEKKNHQNRTVYTVTLSFKSEDKIDLLKQKLAKFVFSRPILKEMSKGVLQREEKWYRSKTWIYTKKEKC